jgi:hypothetical protein
MEIGCFANPTGHRLRQNNATLRVVMWAHEPLSGLCLCATGDPVHAMANMAHTSRRQLYSRWIT